MAEDIDVIAAPEIDITAGEEEGDVEFDAVVEVRPVVDAPGLRRPAGRDPEPRRSPTRPSTRRSTRCASASPTSRTRRRRSSTATSPRSTSRGTSTTRSSTRSAPPTSSTRSAPGSLVDELDAELRGERAGDILKFNADAARALRRAGRRRGLVPGPRQGGQAQGAARADRRVGVGGERVRHGRRAARRRPRRLELVGKVQAQMALRDKVLEAVAGLVDIEIPEAARRPGDGAPPPRPRRTGSSTRAPRSRSTSPPRARTRRRSSAGVREGATAAVRADLALAGRRGQEEIEATDEDLDAEIDRLAERVGQKPEKVRRDLGKRGALEAVRSDLARGKALQFLVDHAKVVDEEGNPVDLTLPQGEPAARPPRPSRLHRGDDPRHRDPDTETDRQPGRQPRTEEPQA